LYRLAASDVISLRTGLAALAFFGADQLFEFAVKFFDLSTHVINVLNDIFSVWRRSRIEAVRVGRHEPNARTSWINCSWSVC